MPMKTSPSHAHSGTSQRSHHSPVEESQTSYSGGSNWHKEQKGMSNRTKHTSRDQEKTRVLRNKVKIRVTSITNHLEQLAIILKREHAPAKHRREISVALSFTFFSRKCILLWKCRHAGQIRHCVIALCWCKHQRDQNSSWGNCTPSIFPFLLDDCVTLCSQLLNYLGRHLQTPGNIFLASVQSLAFHTLSLIYWQRK